MRVSPVTAALLAFLAGGCGAKTAEIDRLQSLLEANRVLSSQRGERADAAHQALEGELGAERASVAMEREEVGRLQAELARLTEEKVRVLEDRGALRAQVDEMRAALAELERQRLATESRVQAYRDLVERFRALIDAGALEVRIVDGRMVVILSSDILFPSGSAGLSSDGESTLTAVAGVLAELDRPFQVEGHTDNVPIHTERFPDNWYLGSARAIGVVGHLVKHGVPPERLSAASYGEHRPRAFNDTADSRARNRRIEIVVVPDLSELPGAEELADLDRD
jgi:chemotaxis protein MotB